MWGGLSFSETKESLVVIQKESCRVIVILVNTQLMDGVDYIYLPGIFVPLLWLSR